MEKHEPKFNVGDRVKCTYVHLRDTGTVVEVNTDPEYAWYTVQWDNTGIHGYPHQHSFAHTSTIENYTELLEVLDRNTLEASYEVD